MNTFLLSSAQEFFADRKKFQPGAVYVLEHPIVLNTLDGEFIIWALLWEDHTTNTPRHHDELYAFAFSTKDAIPLKVYVLNQGWFPDYPMIDGWSIDTRSYYRIAHRWIEQNPSSLREAIYRVGRDLANESAKLILSYGFGRFPSYARFHDGDLQIILYRDNGTGYGPNHSDLDVSRVVLPDSAVMDEEGIITISCACEFGLLNVRVRFPNDYIHTKGLYVLVVSRVWVAANYKKIVSG